MADYQIRLGKTMPFTSQDGAEHPESFWCLNSLTAAIGDNALNLSFVGYHSIEAYDANAQVISGATKSYTVFGFDAFHEIIDGPVMLPLGAQTPAGLAILAMAWAVALETLEGAPPAAGEPDTRESFFTDAVDAPPPTPPTP